jgi:hypothetical protein
LIVSLLSLGNFCTLFYYFIKEILPICECEGICEFEQDLNLFPNIVPTAEANAQVEHVHGITIKPTLYLKLGYQAYFQAVYGYLGRGVRHP